jgi:very-short-patch-repair endonuclease
MTETERFVWAKMRNRRLGAYKFRRQVPLGNYIVDFVTFAGHLIIELDGGQHAEPGQQAYDAERTRWLESQGFRVLRFWDNEVLSDWEPVEEAIGRALEGTDPSPRR